MLDNAIQHYWKHLVEKLYHIVPSLGGRMHFAEGGKMFKKRGADRPQSASDDAHVDDVRALI